MGQKIYISFLVYPFLYSTLSRDVICESTLNGVSVVSMIFRAITATNTIDDLIIVLDGTQTEYYERKLAITNEIPKLFPYNKTEIISVCKLINIEPTTPRQILKIRVLQLILLHLLKTAKSLGHTYFSEIYDQVDEDRNTLTTHPSLFKIREELECIVTIGAYLFDDNIPVADTPAQKNWETFISFNTLLKEKGVFDMNNKDGFKLNENKEYIGR